MGVVLIAVTQVADRKKNFLHYFPCNMSAIDCNGKCAKEVLSLSYLYDFGCDVRAFLFVQQYVLQPVLL